MLREHSAFGTSIYSAGMFQVAEQFHVTSTVAILGLSMYSFGLGAFCPLPPCTSPLYLPS